MSDGLRLGGIVAALVFATALAIWSAAHGHQLATTALATCAGFDAALLIANLCLLPILRSLRATIASQAETIRIYETLLVTPKVLRPAHVFAQSSDWRTWPIEPFRAKPRILDIPSTPACATCGAGWKAIAGEPGGWIKGCACIPRGTVE